MMTDDGRQTTDDSVRMLSPTKSLKDGGRKTDVEFIVL